MTAPDTPRSESDDRLLPWKRVKDITGLSRTTAWRLQKKGDFPAPLVISPGRVGWRAGEVAAWAASRTPRGASDRRGPAQSDSERSPQEGTAEAPPQRPPPPINRAPRSSRTRRRSNSRPDQLGFDF